MEKIIVFGAGERGVKFIYQYHNKLTIHALWDNRRSGKVLGYRVDKPSSGADARIVVTTDRGYEEIRGQLIDMGYREFEDFVPYQIYGRKMAVAYGNCHMESVSRYLTLHKQFSQEYGFYPFPAVCNMKEEFPYEEILRHCDLFLHQSIRRDNKYGIRWCSENLLRCLREDCRIIAIPNLFGMGDFLFPQFIRGWNPVGVDLGERDCFLIDANVYTWLKEGKVKEEIKRMILGGVYMLRRIFGADGMISRISFTSGKQSGTSR